MQYIARGDVAVDRLDVGHGLRVVNAQFHARGEKAVDQDQSGRLADVVGTLEWPREARA